MSKAGGKMSNINNGGAEFPIRQVDYAHPSNFGMTLRDYFAGLAMQGLLAADAERERWNARDYANSAYVQADAMIKARDGEE
jgi:hypothetical protein